MEEELNDYLKIKGKSQIKTNTIVSHRFMSATYSNMQYLSRLLSMLSIFTIPPCFKTDTELHDHIFHSYYFFFRSWLCIVTKEHVIQRDRTQVDHLFKNTVRRDETHAQQEAHKFYFSGEPKTSICSTLINRRYIDLNFISYEKLSFLEPTETQNLEL